MTDATSTASPSTTKERHGFVDALRGFSLLGILLVNIEFIIQPAEIGWAEFTGTTDQVVRWLVVTLAQTKIYPLFALLFGYGLAIQMERAGTDATLRSRYRRRMLGLVLLGIVHGIFFFPGDILVIYAAVGMLAFRMRTFDSRRLVKIAVIVYAVASAAWLVLGLLDALEWGGPPTADAGSVATLMNGSFLEVAEVQFGYWLVVLLLLVFVQGPSVFACFLAGIALGRTRWLAEPEAHTDKARLALRWFPPALVVAGIGAALTVDNGKWATLGSALGFGAAPFIAAGYLALLSLLLPSRPRLSRIFERSGHMSLTVYLSESILAAAVSYGYGLGRFTEASPLESVTWAVGIWLVLTVFSIAWMGRFRFGPFEWLLRSWTYRSVQSMTKR